MQQQGLIQRYRKYLPVSDDAEIVSLCEGSTPLIHAYSLGPKIHERLDV